MSGIRVGEENHHWTVEVHRRINAPAADRRDSPRVAIRSNA
jgi:hypothetical protein